MAAIRDTLNSLIAPIEVADTVFDILLEKWQYLLYEGLDISLSDVADEDAYSFEGNLLIAYLILRDLVYNSTTQAVLASGGFSSITLGQSSGISGMQGAIKKIETGPVNVERHDGAASASKLYAAVLGKGGMWDEILLQICSLANRLSLLISGCSPHVTVPIKVIRASDYSYENQYPHTPATAQRASE